MARFKVGTVDREGVFVNADIDESGELHIDGDVLRSGHIVACGQVRDEVRTVVERGSLAKGITKPTIERLMQVWERWHLNHMKAGCEHQRAMGWDKEGYDRHPSEPCPTCGYKYGTAWLKEELPADVREFIAGLPHES